MADLGALAARRPRTPGPAGLELLGLALVLGGLVVLAVLRWSGHAPFGSDHDEYRMLATTLWERGEPTVAGIEGTKYPLGYSLVLGGLGRLGLDMTTTAMVVNVAFVVGLVLGTWWVARRVHPAAGLVAATLVGLSPTLWDSVYVVMPDLALTALTLAGFAWVLGLDDARRRSRRRVVVAASLVALGAVALKTFGIVLAGALGVALFVRPRWRSVSWVPPLVGIAGVALQALAVSRYPEHTTGYAATFWLRDPADAAGGSIGPADLPARIFERLDGIVAQAGRGLLGGQAEAWLAVVVIVVLLIAAIAGVRGWRASLSTHLVVSVLVLAAWPYRDARFALPMVPLAAVGGGVIAGWLLGPVRSGWRRGRSRGARTLAGLVVVGALAAHGTWAVQRIRNDAAGERSTWAELQVAMDGLEDWVRSNTTADAAIASLDYREIAYRIDRPVEPIGYSSDPDDLLADVDGAALLVSLRGLYGDRAGLADLLVSAHPDRFRRVYANDRVLVHRIVRSGGS